MSMSHARFVIPLAMLGSLPAMPAAALLPAVYSFSTGDPDGLIATAARPDSTGKFEIELADDFVLTQHDLDHQRDLHRPRARRDRAPSAGPRRDLPRVSHGFGCRPHQRVANVLDGPSANARQFALRRRVRRARRRDRPSSRPRVLDPSFTANNSVTAGRYQSQSELKPPAATVRSRARKCSST